MKYQKISMEQWPRAVMFRHYINNLRCVISVTADVDVTDVLSFCKKSGQRFYPTFLYFVSKAVNSRSEFRMGYDCDGAPILWDSVSPSHIVFHPEDELFTRLITDYDPVYQTFYQRVLDDMKVHQDKRGLEILFQQKNTFDVSCLPWLHYNSCDLHVFDSGTYLAPVITWGKYRMEHGCMMLPLTMQIHHAAADGYHVAMFFEEIRREIQNLGAGQLL